jgi:hypothetical protein
MYAHTAGRSMCCMRSFAHVIRCPASRCIGAVSCRQRHWVIARLTARQRHQGATMTVVKCSPSRAKACSSGTAEDFQQLTCNCSKSMHVEQTCTCSRTCHSGGVVWTSLPKHELTWSALEPVCLDLECFRSRSACKRFLSSLCFLHAALVLRSDREGCHRAWATAAFLQACF